MDYSVLQQVTHGAIQFTAYEELRKVFVNYRSRDDETNMNSDNLLVSQRSLLKLCIYLNTQRKMVLFH